MLNFIRNFTDDLSRRFNTTALDVAPSSFGSSDITLIADIERPTTEDIRVSQTVTTELFVSGTQRTWTFTLAETPGQSPAAPAGQSWKIDLTKVLSIDLLATVVHGQINNFGGGVGNIVIERRIKATGTNLTPDYAQGIYYEALNVPVVAGVGSLFSFDRVEKRIYTGQTIYSNRYGGAGADPGSPKFLAPQVVVFVPGTSGDVQFDSVYFEYHFRVTYLKQPVKNVYEDIAFI